MDDGDEEESDLTSISCMVGRLAFMNSLVLLRLAVTHLLQNTETLLFHSPVVWHAKVIFIQLSKYQSTFKISFNFVKNIAQLSKYGTTFRNISHSSGRVYIFWEHV